MDKACEQAREGNMEYISSLAEPDLQRLVKAKDEDGRSLLHAAASGGNGAMVNFLIEKGAAPSVNQADDEARRFQTPSLPRVPATSLSPACMATASSFFHIALMH